MTDKAMMYTFCLENPTDNPITVTDDLDKRLTAMEQSQSEDQQIGARVIRRLPAQGIVMFSKSECPKMTGLPKERAYDMCYVMAGMKIIRNISNKPKTIIYMIITDEKSEAEPISPRAAQAVISTKEKKLLPYDRRMVASAV
ncbi:MAG: hypothetical protein IKE04_05040 [Oscillospiraceae bacterium]|nr:hypothetical protein [Oscillospiraceae bacterium]